MSEGVLDRAIAGARALARRGIVLAARLPPARRALLAVHRRLNRDNPMMRTHPLDLRYGVDTSGFAPSALLGGGGTAYASCQPSTLRRAMEVLPDTAERTFVDLGSGKGRALVVASEFPFRQLVGLELDPELARVAGANADVIARAYPERPRMRILVEDATSATLPSGDLVVFLYNPFGEELVAQAMANVRRAMDREPREVHVVYDNAAHEGAVDRAGFERCHDEVVPLAPEEVGYSPWTEFRLVIWRGSSREA